MKRRPESVPSMASPISFHRCVELDTKGRETVTTPVPTSFRKCDTFGTSVRHRDAGHSVSATQTSGMRRGKRMRLTPASLLMAIQISRVIERSSIWMPSARDVTRNRAITLPFLGASLSFSPSLAYQALSSVSASLDLSSLLCFYSRWMSQSARLWDRVA